MRKLLQVIFLVLIPQLFIAIAIYNIQNMPNYNNIEELKEKYSTRKLSVKDHSEFEELQKEFASAHEITAACLSCHKERGHELLMSHHFTWEKEEYIPGRGVVYYGKKNALNNFCTGIAAGSEPTCSRCHAGYGYSDPDFDFTDPNNVDCLVCHDNSFNYKKRSGGSGYPEIGENAPDYQLIFANLGTPRLQNCGVCHFHSAGGNNVKHGDLEIALIDCAKEVDVHMSPDGAGLQCVDCHTTENHVMKGRYYGLSSTNERRAKCEDCHTPFPHKDDLMNEHTIKVDCRTCHIPTYAKVNPTKMYWDWSTACDLKNGMPYVELDEQGNKVYLSEKGSFIWGQNVQPQYQWFNGTANHHFLTDSITEIPVQINTLYGEYNDPKSKLIPKKVHKGKQPYDLIYNRIVQAKLWDYEKGKGALWVDFNWTEAIDTAMEYLQIPYSGQYGFVETEVHLPISHMVSPKENVVSCSECHTRENSRLQGINDFYLPGRDRNRYVDMGGIILIIFTLGGVLGHAGIRYYNYRKMNSRQQIHINQNLIKKQVYIYKLFERFWHWSQALLIFVLMFTGFEIHSSYEIIGFELAVRYHNVAAISLLILVVFAIFWHFTTGEWKQYIPTAKNLKAQVNYYIFGIFRNAPHPTRKTQLSKLNPLQRLVYLGLKIILIPLMVVTGIMYLLYRYPQKGEIVAGSYSGLEIVAVLHTIGAYLLVAFVIAHLYLITTGHTISSNLKAMITGFEELEEEDEKPRKTENETNK